MVRRVCLGLLGGLLGSLVVAGCGQAEAGNGAVEMAPVTVETVPLAVPQPCSGNFVFHNLDHVTTVPGGDEVRMFEANGGGAALGDLDNDGDLDVVLANHYDSNTILWNEANLTFRTERMSFGDSRAVNLVDVNGDGRQDIVVTRVQSAPNYWHNEGNGTFRFELLSGLNKPVYAMDWADVDGDGDLDMAAASYDAGLLADLGSDFLLGDGAGVYYYENQGDGDFEATRLASSSQALALTLLDLNDDNQLDILVGNDFAVPDQAWLRQDGRWVEASPFAATTHSTMSFDAGDVNNDGRPELFATDMKPYDESPEMLADWQPVMEGMDHPPAGDPQVMANVLQINQGNEYRNAAEAWGIDATGWSWSGKFGDLDSDGFLDLYVVNGMAESTTFAHLPNHELVEENQAFRNDGRGQFVPAPEWGLGSTLSGRGMSMGDLDSDGDLDIVVNNLRSPAQLFENQLCSGHNLQVDLFHPGSKNTHALGAKVALRSSSGIYTRLVRAGSGYLSGDPARIHFGFPADAELHSLIIRWPDGVLSEVEALRSQTLITIKR
ncbi:MAG TPA: CRTAC1 family protein [Anaerolineae bacterium]